MSLVLHTQAVVVFDVVHEPLTSHPTWQLHIRGCELPTVLFGNLDPSTWPELFWFALDPR